MKPEVDIKKITLGKAITRRMVGGAIMFLIAIVFWNLGDLPPPLPNAGESIVINNPPPENDFYLADSVVNDASLSADDEKTGTETDSWDDDVMNAAADEITDTYEEINNADNVGGNDNKTTEVLTTVSASEEVVQQKAVDDEIFIAAETFSHTVNANNYKKRLLDAGFDVVIQETVSNGAKMQQVGMWAKRADRQAIKKKFSEIDAASRSPFEIQVFVSELRKKANRIASELSDNQYKTRVDDVVRDGRTLYRVRVTGFQERSEADLAKRKLRPVLHTILRASFGDSKERNIFIVSEQ